MMARSLIKTVLTVIFGFISSDLQQTGVAASNPPSKSKLNIWTKCKGDSFVLSEPVSNVTAHHVYVFHNGISVASTSVPATGQMKGRLLLNADSSVMMTNLSSDDFGLYRTEVKISEDKSTERNVKLVIGEPPATVDGKLMAMLDTSNDTVISLKCGRFTSLGYPSVSAIWKDPTGQILVSTGFTGSHFTLDLPADVARPGPYCCHLECRDPNFCCLDDGSPLRRCAAIDVQADNKTGRKESATDETALVKHCEFDRLERRVSAMDTIVQELEKSERQQQSQMCVAAMFYQVQREAKCDHLDSSADQLLKAQAELWNELNVTNSNLSSLFQQSARAETALKELIQQQRNTDDWMSRISAELNFTRRNLATILTQDTLRGELMRHGNETSSWVLKVSGALNQMNKTLTTSGQLVAALDNKTEIRMSEINTKIASIENSLQMYMRNTSDFYQNIQRTPSTLPTGFCPTNKGYSWYGERCLKISTRSVNFQSAQRICVADGAHLLYLKTAEEASVLRDVVRATGITAPPTVNDPFLHFWVGATDLVTKGRFLWGDGTSLPSSSLLWYRGEPNDKQGKENCVEVRLILTVPSIHLNDESCATQFRYFCEYD